MGIWVCGCACASYVGARWSKVRRSPQSLERRRCVVGLCKCSNLHTRRLECVQYVCGCAHVCMYVCVKSGTNCPNTLRGPHVRVCMCVRACVGVQKVVGVLCVVWGAQPPLEARCAHPASVGCARMDTRRGVHVCGVTTDRPSFQIFVFLRPTR